MNRVLYLLALAALLAFCVVWPPAALLTLAAGCYLLAQVRAHNQRNGGRR